MTKRGSNPKKITPQQSALRYCAIGDEYYKNGQYASAAVEYVKATGDDGGNYLYHAKLADTYYRQKDLQSAKKQYAKAADLLYAAQNYIDANDFHMKVMECAKYNAESLNATAISYYKQKQFDTSAFYLQELTKREPVKPKYFNNLGKALFCLKEYLSSENAYTQAEMRYTSDNTLGKQSLARAFYRLSEKFYDTDQPRAQTCLKKAAQYNPKAFSQYLYNTDDYLEIAGRTSDAEAEIL